ncbi:MAG: flagellar basal body rod protein FlgB [Verrucomicrobiota bacterium]
MTNSITPLFNDSTLQSLKLTLDAASLRHGAIASNIANISTPGYKRLDVAPQFQTEFQNALAQLNRGEEAHPLYPANTIQKDASILSEKADGNNVNLDSEMLEMTKNQTLFEFSSTLAAKRYNGLKVAITGRTS